MTRPLPGEDTTAGLNTKLSAQYPRGCELGRVSGWGSLTFRDYKDKVCAAVGVGEVNGAELISSIYHHAIADSAY